MNKGVTKNIFPHRPFHAERECDIYFHVQLLLRKLEGILQPHVSPFIPLLPLHFVLSECIQSKPEYNNNIFYFHLMPECVVGLARDILVPRKAVGVELNQNCRELTQQHV